jgi:RNA polymerase sigma-70 factor (ECF subfamily)
MMLLVNEAVAPKVKLDIGQLAVSHYDQVFRFCSVRVGYHHAGDAAQETFITAQRILPKFRGESKPLTWLMGIALNECRRINRTRKDGEPMVEFGAPTPEGQIVDREALRVALARLSPEHREVVLLHEVDGFTYDEIAEIAGIPVGTVKSRLYHAFLNLRQTLAPSEVA